MQRHSSALLKVYNCILSVGFASVGNLRALRKKTHRRITYTGPGLELANSPRYSRKVNAYTVPLAVADVPVVKLGQQILENHKEQMKSAGFGNKYQPPSLPPVHFVGYFSFSSFIAIAYVMYIGALLTIASKLVFFRKVV